MLFKKVIDLAVHNVQHQQVRHRWWANVRPITGWPRPYLAKRGKPYPEPHTYNWLPYLPADGRYTIKSLPIQKLGGRNPETGHVVVRTLGGGNPKRFRWVDMHRRANDDGSTREEQVLQLKYDPLSTPKLALVADAERTRWIYATEGIQVGDIIRTYSEIPRNPIRAKNGDAHPIGALPVGTKIHLVEIFPGQGAKFCLVAGSCAAIVKRSTNWAVFQLPHKDQYKVDARCMAVVGQLSNVGYNLVQTLCPQRNRWWGKRPRSGQWHRKDGWCGRKIKPPKPLRDLTLDAIREKNQRQPYTELSV